MFHVKMLCFSSIWCIWGVLISVLDTVSTSTIQQKPHVLFIIADDMGWNDVSFHGSDQIQTPNIDALAYQGVILQNYYSEAICTPARTALLTGKYPMRLGMQGRPLANSEDRGIPLTERLLPSYMKDFGYSTHLVGKWHVGMSREEYLPTQRGYDTHYGNRGGFIDYYTHYLVENPDFGLLSGLDFFDNNIPLDNEQRYTTDALTDRTIKIIQGHNGSRPLFLHVAYTAPHSGNDGGALQPPLDAPVENKHIANSDRRLYAAMVTHLDYSIGRLISSLNQANMLNNTIIVFVSDNGSPTIGANSNWGVNLPFRGLKATPWEGALRVPAFIWHASFRPKVWDGLMHITDWLPTLTAAAGGEFLKEIDGVNQWDSIVKDSESNRREIFTTLTEAVGNLYAAYRTGDYKLVVGNLSEFSNDYYGADFIKNKATPPDYFSTLKACEVTQNMKYLGKYLDYNEVQTMRKAATIVQQDPERDDEPCEPTPKQGCLYNVRKDPLERHNLWKQDTETARNLTTRLQELLAQQMRVKPVVYYPAADPANFDYRWMPWINDNANKLCPVKK